MGNPVIRKFSLFCKGLENMDEGISHGKEGESKIRDTVETKVQTSWESHQPQISSASEPSKLSLQVTGWCVGLTGFSAFFSVTHGSRGLLPGVWEHKGWSAGLDGALLARLERPFGGAFSIYKISRL